ncbi:hypothetical protein WICMUC_000615 [Wickerhamomyces mucosus]|uniref:Uncharacterized protein n=1 Tax=Wickerhamomyces mucosus TaxID=1378264 RepID=A0A9P8PYC6_9ASCO|nr:hypothetical protein WICMUC_000615 [Wickerhamomyces mucosus]
MKKSQQLSDKRPAKQFSTRNPARSASYGRNLNKLGRITSLEEMHQRPGLNRSKSSDGIQNRRNKSFNKLSTLQPLRTKSHQLLPTRGSSKIVIELDKDEESSDDEGNKRVVQYVEEEEVESFSDDETSVNKNDKKKNNPYSTNNNNIIINDKNSSIADKQSQIRQEFSNPNVQKIIDQHKTNDIASPKKLSQDDIGRVKLKEQAQPLMLSEQNPKPNNNQHQKKVDRDTFTRAAENNSVPNDYYHNMILSQSTGAVRDFGDQPFKNSLIQMEQVKNVDTLQYIHSNDNINGTFKSVGNSSNSLKQFTVQTSNQKLGTSQDSSSLLSFKAGNGITMKSANNLSRQQQYANQFPNSSGFQGSLSSTPNNFNQFLKTNGSNIETRTQQRLWLQRESSLLDVTSANSTNQQSNNPQIRREFERISRELLNVRRFSNPLADAIKRVHIPNNKAKDHESIMEMTQERLQNFKTDEIQSKLTKLWIAGDSVSKPTPSVNYGLNESGSQDYFQHRPQPIFSPQNSYANNLTSQRVSMPPTTRAVDRAHINSTENMKIDLNAIRVNDEHSQKLI